MSWACIVVLAEVSSPWRCKLHRIAVSGRGKYETRRAFCVSVLRVLWAEGCTVTTACLITHWGQKQQQKKKKKKKQRLLDDKKGSED